MVTDNLRMFSAFYDSVEQKSWSVEEDASSDTMYLARLRLDSLLNQTVALTDSQILDGRFFAGMVNSSPEDIPVGRIEIRARAERLEDCIVGIVRRSGQDKLAGFKFSYLDDEESAAVKNFLIKTPASEVSDWTDVPRLIRMAGIDPEKVDSLQSAWGRLIAMQSNQKGMIRVKKWTSDWNTHFDLEFSRYADEVRSRMVFDAGKAAYQFAVENRYDRSLVVFKLESMIRDFQAEQDSISVNEVAAVLSWYNGVYNRAIGSQHGCSVSEVQDVPDAKAYSSDTSAFDRLMDQYVFRRMPEDPGQGDGVSLPKDFLISLGSMPNSDFSELLESTANYLGPWYAEGNRLGLHLALDALVRRVERLGYQHVKPVGQNYFVPFVKLMVMALGQAAVSDGDQMVFQTVEQLADRHLDLAISRSVLVRRIMRYNRGVREA